MHHFSFFRLISYCLWIGISVSNISLCPMSYVLCPMSSILLWRNLYLDLSWIFTDPIHPNTNLEISANIKVIWNWRQIIVWLTSSGLGWLWVDGCTRPTDGLDRTAKLQPTRATIATIANHCKQLQQLQQLQTMETIATITNNCKQLQTIANNGNNCNSCKQLQTIANNCNNYKQLHSIAKNCKHWQTTKNGKQ